MAKTKKVIPKTQREISISLQEPYKPGDPPTVFDPNGSGQLIPNYSAAGFSYTGNPNSANELNRGLQTSFKDDTVKPISIGLEDLDWAIMYYFQNVIKPTVLQNGESIPVPVIYGSPEKWKSFQTDGYYRDLNGRIMAPLLMFKRNNIEKNRGLANKLDANQPHNIVVTGKKYSPQNYYSNFSLLNNLKPEETLYATVVPDYLTVTYDCAVFTYYNDQLNKIIEAVEYASDAYWGDPERFKFKTNIDSFASTTELSDSKERIVKSTFSLKMHGYIIPDIIQKDLNSIKKFSNRNKLSFTTEATNNLNNLNP
jgi:hypothetical protein